MYYHDHAPPHFHAIYGEFEAAVTIATASIMEGQIPSKARLLVEEWAGKYRTELDDDWKRARAGQPLLPIPPLE